MKHTRERLGVSARLNTSMPRFYDLIGRPAPFGTLDTSDIIAILADQKWYGDGQPRWRQAPTARKFQDKWLKEVKRLHRRQFHTTFPSSPTVAALIGGCSEGRRCASNGCYLCARAFQRWLIWAVKQLHRNQLSGYHDVAFNYVFPAGQAAIGDLNKVPFDEVAAKCRETLARSGDVRHGILAYDISLNVDTAKFSVGTYRSPPPIYWQVHIYGIARTKDPAAVFDALKSLYPPDEKIDKPVMHKPFDGSNYAASYLMKPEAYRRVSFWSTSGKKHDWKTFGCSLKAAEQVEYLLAGHDLGFARRVTLINLHPVKLSPTTTGKKRVGLRVTAP